MPNARIEQLSAMYAKIANVSLSDATNTILNTPTGKAVARNNPYILYEQPSSNLLDILSEIPAAIRPHYDVPTILRAEAEYQARPRTRSSIIQIKSQPSLKKTMRKHLKANYSSMVKSASKSRILVKNCNRRDSYVIESKR